jgi:small subunit ribosomal protein S18
MAKIIKKDPLEGQNIDYKNTELLKNYITKFGKIVPRYYT